MRERGRRNLLSVAVAAALLAATVANATALPPETPPRISAKAAVVMDGTTGRILWERDAHRALPPASTTKILTTVLALESGRLDRSLVVSPVAAAQEPSKLGLRPGQQVELEDLTYALMLKSANDASVVVAEGLAGSVREFAELMNARARELGASGSNFANPHGLPNGEHVATPYDMGLILRHALTVPGFREVAATRSRVIHVSDRKVRQMSLYSKNRLLSGYFVPVVGKTGYTRAAGRCFAGAAELNGRKIITVVFGAPDMWGDTRRLMEYGFSSFDDTAPAVQVALERERRTQRAVAKAKPKRSTRSVARSKGRKSTKAAVARKPKPATASKSAKSSAAKTTTAKRAAQAKPTKAQTAARSSATAATSREQHARLSSKASASASSKTASQRR
jgi:D-alanyl-D-alanine carboxypeptidase (penicillin-binding protein 5/6)